MTQRISTFQIQAPSSNRSRRGFQMCKQRSGSYSLRDSKLCTEVRVALLSPLFVRVVVMIDDHVQRLCGLPRVHGPPSAFSLTVGWTNEATTGMHVTFDFCSSSLTADYNQVGQVEFPDTPPRRSLLSVFPWASSGNHQVA